MKDYELYKKGIYKNIATTIKTKYENGKVTNFANPKKVAIEVPYPPNADMLLGIPVFSGSFL